MEALQSLAQIYLWKLFNYECLYTNFSCDYKNKLIYAHDLLEGNCENSTSNW